jgi:hypothetical protein
MPFCRNPLRQINFDPWQTLVVPMRGKVCVIETANLCRKRDPIRRPGRVGVEYGIQAALLALRASISTLYF